MALRKRKSYRNKGKKKQVYGRFVQIKIFEQYNSHDVIFKRKAKIDNPEQLRSLFREAEMKGLDLPEFPL